MAGLSPFDLIDTLNKKKYQWDEDVEKAYAPFTINRALSNNPDCVLAVAELNCFGLLDKKMQYDFLYHLLPKKARYGGWAKAASKNRDEEMIIEVYGTNRDTARDFIKTLDAVNPEWRTEFETKLSRGGRTK